MTLPELDYETSKDSLERLHLILQLLGHTAGTISEAGGGSKESPLQLTARGLSTPLLPGGVDMRLDMLQQEIRLAAVSGKVSTVSFSAASLESVRSELLEGLSYLEIEASPELPELEAGEEPEDFASVLRSVLTAWAGTCEVLERFARRFNGPDSGVTLDWSTMNLALSLYNGKEVDEAQGEGNPAEDSLRWQQFGCGLALGDEMVPEATFYSYLHPAVEEIEGALRPSGATFKKERGQAQLVYRALAPRTDWPTALGWFFESAFEQQAGAAGWEMEKLYSPA